MTEEIATNKVEARGLEARGLEVRVEVDKLPRAEGERVMVSFECQSQY